MYVRLLTIAAFVCSLWAQPSRSYRIDTVTGTVPVSEGVSAVTAILEPSQVLAAGSDGAIYAGSRTSGIHKITPAGMFFRVSGSGAASGVAVGGDGTLYYIGGPELYTQPANSETVSTSRPTDGVISFRNFTGVVVDTNGNVLIADERARQVLRVAPDGSVSVAAGIGSKVALSAPPSRLAVDALNNIYIAQADRRVVRLSAGGVQTVLAGNGAFGTPVVGATATASPVGSLGALAVTSRGEIFVVDGIYRSILKVNASGVIENAVRDVDASDIALDAAGNLIFAEAGKIWRLLDDGTRALIAGRDRFDGDGGPATTALLNSPRAVAVDPSGMLFIGDTANNRIRRVSPDGTITTVAGTGVAGLGGDGGPAATAQIAGPDLLVSDRDGNLYFSSLLKVRRLRTDGVIETVAGTGANGSFGDGGRADAATFQSIDGLAVDNNGRVFISDRSANRIRVVNSDGTIDTYAVATRLSGPSRLAIDKQGNLIVYESGTLRLSRVSATGIVTTLSSLVPFGTPGDNLAANGCVFSGGMSGLAFDIDDSLLVAGNAVVCRLMPDGTSWLVAGSGRSGFAGDGGPALSAMLSVPSSLAVSRTGAIYFTDSGNHRVRRLQPSSPEISSAYTGQSGTFTLTTDSPTYAWTASSNQSWLQVFPLSGTGTAVVAYTVFPNYTTHSRTGIITVGAQTFTVTQAGSTGTPDERFVGQMYSNYFGRVSGADEVTFQTGALAQGVTTRPKLVLSFLNSAEFNAAGKFVAGVYAGLLNRTADYGGWLFQRNALIRRETSPQSLVGNVINGAEFQLQHPGMSDADFVRLLYSQILGRTATRTEVTNQVNNAITGKSNGRRDLAVSFLNLEEFRNRSNAKLDAFLLYAVLLQRDASVTEFNNRVAQLRSGTPIGTLVDDILNSPDFASLLQ